MEHCSIPGQEIHLQKHPMISEENITTSIDSNVISLPPQSSLHPVPLKQTLQVTHNAPIPPLSPVQGEDLGDLVPLGKYSSKVHCIDPIPDLGTDTGSSEEILIQNIGSPQIWIS